MQQLKGYLFFCFALSFFCSNAQSVSYLEKKVTLNKTNVAFTEVLNDIASQTGVVFSYNPSQFDDKRKVGITAYKKPLRLVLDQLLKGTQCSYKLKNNYVLFVYKPKIKEETPPMVISGYVYNLIDSSVVSNASIYIVSGRYSTLTDQFGYFSLTFPKNQNLISLSVAKENFIDTTILLLNPNADKILVFLAPVREEPVDTTDFIPVADSINQAMNDTSDKKADNKLLEFWLKLRSTKINLKNINDTLFSDYSVSFFPPISTNKLLAVNTMNKVSFNVLAGASKGVKYFEFGGLLNIDNGKVSYGQIAGIGNVVTDTVKGGQIGGVFNIVQSQVNGAQIGGVFNLCEVVNGAQVGGVFNLVSGRVQGIQIGGIFNNTASLKGLQIGGIFNNSGNLDGLQLGGIFNHADTIRGMQLAGIYNKANKSSGMQLAGIYNYSKSHSGVQLALINISDTLKGVPIGLFSFVKSGYHKIELSGTELGFINVGFRSGVEQFHNFFFAGFTPFQEQKLYSFGYGIGTTLKIKNRWNITTEISAQQIQPSTQAVMNVSLLNKVFTGVDFVSAKRMRIAVGPSLNVFVYDSKADYYQQLESLIGSKYFSSEVSGNYITKMWLGATLSLKFL